MLSVLFTMPLDTSNVVDAFLKAFESAKGNFDRDDDIKRKIVRFSLNLMQNFLGNLTCPF